MSQLEVFYEGNLSTRCVHLSSGSEVITEYAGMSPTELLAASLGACVLTVMALTGRKMGVELSGAKVLVEKEMSRDLPRRVSHLKVHFKSSISLPSEVLEKLETAGIECPIHHSLHPDTKVEFHFTWGDS